MRVPLVSLTIFIFSGAPFTAEEGGRGMATRGLQML